MVRRWVLYGGFYGGLTALLLVILFGWLPLLVSSGLASRISYNSEAYLFAVVLAAWLQFGLPRLDPARRMPWALAVGAVWIVIGAGLLASDLPSRIRTLNESAFALGVLIPYVTLRRPVNRWFLAVVPLSIGLVAWSVVWAPDSWVIDQAETVGFIVLAILTFDVVDRELLEPRRRTTPGTRFAWYGFLVVEPVVVSALGTELRTGGGALALALEFLGRIHESFVGVLLVAAIIILIRQTHQEKVEVQSGSTVSMV